MTLHCLYHPADTPAARRLYTDLYEGHLNDNGEPGAENDAVLLLGAAVSLSRITHPALDDWLNLGVPLYALSEDLQAYGVTSTHASIEEIDYAGWVTLSTQHATQMLWR